MNVDDAAVDAALAPLFRAAFPVQEAQEEAGWRRFTEQTLPDRQPWIAFGVALAAANDQLGRVLRWTVRQAP